MRSFRKAAAIFLLVIGIPITLLAIADIFNPNEPRSEKEDALAAMVLFGLPPAAGGSWILWGMRRDQRNSQADRLRSAFFSQLQAGQGHITVLGFAMATQLTGDVAKAYLNERAREFDADFKVDEGGGISYYFNLGHQGVQALEPEETYDVILQALPMADAQPVVQVAQELTGQSWQAVQALVQAPPQTLATGVSRDVAEVFKQRLEVVGAQIIVALKVDS